MSREPSTTISEPRTPVSPTSSQFGHSTAVRRFPLPAVKGTVGAIGRVVREFALMAESPRREIFSPTTTLRASEAPSSPPSTLNTPAPSSPVVTTSAPAPVLEFVEPPLVFRADPRLKTCFDSLPEGKDEIKARFGLT